MYISKNYSYISLTEQRLIESNFAKLSVISLNFDRYFTKEEKAENLLLSQRLRPDEWEKRCDEFSRKLEVSMKKILRLFVEKYDIHQVTEATSTMAHFCSDWDLYFNSGGGKYMSSFRLSFNKKRDSEKNLFLLEEILPMVKSLSYQNVYCWIQYGATMDEERVNQEAERLCDKLEGTFVNYRGMAGKIKITGENEYGFFRKNARSKYYVIKPGEIVALSL